MKIKCPQCGKKVKDKFKYCGECGTLIPKQKNAPDKVECTGCMSAISPDIKFCNKCGVQLMGNEKPLKAGKRKKSVVRRIVNSTLLILLAAIVLTIGVYIGAGYLFKHESIKLDDKEDIINNIQNYMEISYEDNEILFEVEEDAINASLLNMDINDIVNNPKIRIDDIYLKSKTLTFYINVKAYGLYFPLSFKLDVDDNEDEIAIKIFDLKHSRLNLPLPAWCLNFALRDKLVISRDDELLPQNIYFKSIDGNKRSIEMVLKVDAEQIMRNIEKELDSASQEILDKMAEKPIFSIAYEMLTGERISKERVSSKLMALMSTGELHQLFLPFAEPVLKEEMGSMLYDIFGMENGMEYLTYILDSTEE